MSVNLCDILERCGLGEVDILKILAATVVQDTEGNVGFNTVVVTGDCADMTPLVTCDNAQVPPEEILRRVFTCDDCGNLAIRIFNVTEPQ